MNIISKARKLETLIARKFSEAAGRATSSRGGPREPLEIVHAIVDRLEEEIQPAGRGRHVFPFNRLRLSVVAPSREARARLEAVFDAAPSLRERLLDRLRAAGCDVADLVVKVGYVTEADPAWTDPDFHLECARGTPHQATAPAPQPPSPDRRLDLEVIAGSAVSQVYTFTLNRIDLGRSGEIRDHRNHLIRTNHVAFADDAADVNQTVSRRHAHIEYHGGSRAYRLYDDRSAHGTGILRAGRTLIVAPGSHGVRLQSGDEIVLGEARVRVVIE